MKLRTSFLFAALLPCAAIGQKFEIADVHASAKTLHPVKFGGGVLAGRYEIEMATMADLISAAYGITPNKVVGGPGWLELDRFDVIARVPPNTSPQDVRVMLQALLVERFHLAVHEGQQPMPAFALTLGSGRRGLKESEGAAPSGCQRQPQAAENGAIPATCHGITMDTFASLLSQAAGDYLESPVVNQTHLEGVWDFTLQWTPRGGLAAAGRDGIPIFEAVEKQLGLKLEAKSLPTTVLIVDRVGETPTANAPGVAEALPAAARPQFEAATIKPTDPAFHGTQLQVTPSVNIRGVTLSYLIESIWFLTPELIAGAPKWLGTERWDLVGKVAAAPGVSPRTDMDSMLTMVRDLIIERFRLQTHLEERTAPVWTLTAVKPKLRRADPANRAGCREGAESGEKDLRAGNPAITRLVTCHNMTMAQFAEQLPTIANARAAACCLYLRAPVLDATALADAYDFTFGFSMQNAVPREADSGLSLTEALSSQLGLKLALEKRPAQVLVIDSIDQQPTDN